MKSPTCALTRALSLLFALGLAGGASAVDGVREINQACADNTGCFSGDGAGLPVTITEPGSYRLTSNLIVPDPYTDGIKVSTSDISIDLNGFAITGPVTCSASPLACSHLGGTGSGIARSSSSNRFVSVKNGSITGMGAAGVSVGDGSEVTNVRVRWNGSDGIAADIGSAVSGNTAYKNTGYGLNLGGGAAYRGNTVTDNTAGGVSGGVSRGDNYCNGIGVVSAYCP